MATNRKTTVKVRDDRRGFKRTIMRFPFDAAKGERCDTVNIFYRPYGWSGDAISVHAFYSANMEPEVLVRWEQGRPTDFLEARAFARALRDAMLEAEKLRRHMGIEATHPQKIEEWKRGDPS